MPKVVEPLAWQAGHCALSLEPIGNRGRIQRCADRGSEHEAPVLPRLARQPPPWPTQEKVCQDSHWRMSPSVTYEYGIHAWPSRPQPVPQEFCIKNAPWLSS